MHVNWWWYYDVENAPGANKSPAQDTGQTNRAGDIPFYWSPGAGACSYKNDLEEPGNLVWSIKDNTDTDSGRPIVSNNNPPPQAPYNGSLALRSNIASGITLAFRLKSISNNIPSGTDVDIIQFNNRLLGGPDLNDRHRFKFRSDGTGNTYLYNSQVGMSGIGNGSPLVSDGWHDVWYTSWVGDDGLYHKRVWLDGVLVYNDSFPFSGETSNERRWGFNSTPCMGEWLLDYFGIYDEGAAFLPPVLRYTFDGTSLNLEWDFGTLQQVDHLPAAPEAWADVDGAASPYPIPLPSGSSKQFFRIRY